MLTDQEYLAEFALKVPLVPTVRKWLGACCPCDSLGLSADKAVEGLRKIEDGQIILSRIKWVNDDPSTNVRIVNC